MTDVIDDSLSWEQRRELRRKKRQELLAEADRLVQNTDRAPASSRISQDKLTDDGDSFEQDRQKRRREREEKRRKEREELEKQLKEEEEARAERERRREERRRQREEPDGILSHHSAPKDSYSYSSTTITTTTKTHHGSDDDEEDVVEKTVTEVTEVISNGQEDYPNENGEDDITVQNGHHKDAEEEVEEYEQDNEDEEDPHTYKSMYTSVTTVTTTLKSRDADESSNGNEEEEGQKEDYDHSVSSSDNEEVAEPAPVVEEPAPKSRSELLQERRNLREKERLEEEKHHKEEEERRKAEYQEKLRVEKEERERRMAEGEAKRKEYRKQSSLDAQPLSPKGSTASPIIMKSDEDSTRSEEDKQILIVQEKSVQQEFHSDVKISKGRMEASSHLSRTQSAHVRSKTTSPSAPSRPLSRKNQTRRSLNELEKQAGDLYSFLSELEDKKSAGPDQLKEFLQETERSEKGGTQKSPTQGRNIQSRSSIRDRMKQFSAIGEENKQPIKTVKLSKDVPCQQTFLATKPPSKSPRPPTRSDSMKRLEIARTKHQSFNRPASPRKNQELSLGEKEVEKGRKSPSNLTQLKEVPVENAESENAVSIQQSHTDSSSVKTSDDETMQSKISEYDNDANIPSKSEPQSFVDLLCTSSSNVPPESKDVSHEKSAIRPGSPQIHEVSNTTDQNVTAVSSDVEKSIALKESSEQSTKEKNQPDNKMNKEEEKVSSRDRVRSRGRGCKPNLPTKPTKLSGSPSGSPSRPPLRPKPEVLSRKSVSKSSNEEISTTVSIQESHPVNPTIEERNEKMNESKEDVTSTTYRASKREARRNRRRNIKNNSAATANIEEDVEKLDEDVISSVCGYKS